MAVPCCCTVGPPADIGLDSDVLDPTWFDRKSALHAALQREAAHLQGSAVSSNKSAVYQVLVVVGHGVGGRPMQCI